jgi:gliding motility-associated protein GldM
MGASNCPETPRQRMIGMMYLVLTALLALNVSVQILDAFVVVDETMVKTNENFESKVSNTYLQFAAANDKQPEKAGPFYKKALEVQKKTNELVEFIKKTKYDMLVACDGVTMEVAKKMTLQEVKGKDNYDKPTLFMIGTTEGRGNARAKELREKIEAYKDFLLSMIDPKQKAEYEKKLGLDTKTKRKNKEGKEIEWESANFYRVVLAGQIPILNKTIGEVKNAEYDMLQYLMQTIDAGSMKFDQVSAKVIPESRLVFSGQEYTADIIVAAFDSRQNPEVYWRAGIDTATESMIGSMTKIDGENGVVKLKIPAGGTGEQKFAGLIKIKTAEGDKYYSFNNKFIVTKPMANVSADSLRILYSGIENPLTIAAPVAPEKLKINFGGCVSRNAGGGRYFVKPPTGAKTVNISISADMEGRSQALGGTPFRIKPVPDPIAYIGGRTKGKVSKSELAGFGRVAAAMSPDFPYILRWNVTSFTVDVKSPTGEKSGENTNNGPAFDGTTSKKINSATPGSRITFSDIQCTNPVIGTRTALNSVSFKIR